jgi:hypothetical protein
MTEIKAFFQGLLTAVLKVTLWLIMAVAAVFLLALALVLLLLGVLWALVRGKKPVPPVFVGRFHRFTTERVWPGTTARHTTDTSSDVVDVEVREVDTRRVSTDGRPPRDTE